jgi:ATP-dependent RNA helicase RhlE
LKDLVNTFADLGLADPLLRAVAAEGYTQPTPIQARVIPEMLQGRDIIGIAQTGTGKTASFVLPVLHALTAASLAGMKRPRPAPRCIGTLILAPTRELAQQIAESIRTYGRYMRPSIGLVVGGANPMPQIKALSTGLDIVVATPGRLLDHVRAGKAKLSTTTTIVLDEADQMLDLGFMPAIQEIMRSVSQQRQTLLLSATMPTPIRALAQQFMHEPVEIAVAAVSKPVERIHQEVILVDQSAKSDLLVDLLAQRQVERAIVFTRTKRGTDRVERMLNASGLHSVGIHGDKSQGQRNRALAQFKSGASRILVATDVAARGLDIDDVSHVVNFDMPTLPEAYVHRIGRTGRAGRSGMAISLCDGAERGLLRDIERLTNSVLSPAPEAAQATAGAAVSSGGPAGVPNSPSAAIVGRKRYALTPLPPGAVRKEEPRRNAGPPKRSAPNRAKRRPAPSR